MASLHFYHPIEVRYGDLDPQGHLNNAKYLTFFEQTRVQYFKHLGLWQPPSFDTFGIILADTRVTYRAPVLFGQPVRVGARITRLGNKSMDMEYVLEDAQTGQVMAVCTAVLVAYDYLTDATIPIPENWRTAINAFEQLETA